MSVGDAWNSSITIQLFISLSLLSHESEKNMFVCRSFTKIYKFQTRISCHYKCFSVLKNCLIALTNIPGLVLNFCRESDIPYEAIRFSALIFYCYSCLFSYLLPTRSFKKKKTTIFNLLHDVLRVAEFCDSSRFRR